MSNKDASNRPNAETITPLSIRRDNIEGGQRRLRRRHRSALIVLIAAVIFVAAAGAWFLNRLSKSPLEPRHADRQSTGQSEAARTPPSPPRTQPQPATEKSRIKQPDPAPRPVSPPREQPQSITDKQPIRQIDPAPGPESTPVAPPKPAVDPAKLARRKQLAEKSLADFMEAKKKLDQIGGAEWGGQSYLEMTDAGSKADSLFIKNEYSAASAEYARATEIGRQIEEQADEVLKQLLAEGHNALTEGNGNFAQKKFKTALMIDPANQTARKGLKRAETIETVLGLIEAGKNHENDNELMRARSEYRKALEIDPAAGDARQALNRVTARIKEQQFRELMSTGLTALHNNDLTQARSSLLKAKSLRPDSREVSEALLQLDQADRLNRIDRLRTTAQRAEKAEDWQKALEAYLNVLKIDKNVQFAILGKERARGQIRLAKRLDFYLSRPRALESDKQLRNATLLLQEANEASPRGSDLIRRTDELAKRIAVARTPVVIIIESDNLTEVAVYKVGRLGRFSQHELRLRPGTYTVVGARDGYQDVRQKIIVKPGQQSLRVTVKCRVKI